MGSTGAWVRVVWAVAVKELRELSRQPLLVVLVVLGPFAVLAAFGGAYRNEELALRTLFVGPHDSVLMEAIVEADDRISRYVQPVGVTTDLERGYDGLRSGTLDLVVVVPPDPLAGLERGEPTEIAVLHDSIDPIERVGIGFATAIAVRELNASVVETSLGVALTALGDLDAGLEPALPAAERLRIAVDDGDRATAVMAAEELADRLRTLSDPIDELQRLSTDPTARVDATDPADTDVGSLRDAVALLDASVERGDGPDEAEAATVSASLDAVVGTIERLGSLEPALVARPFVADVEPLVRQSVRPEYHVAPGVTALLAQHLAMSLAALSLVRDRRRGVLADLRLGPVTAADVLIGKFLALTATATATGLVLLSAEVFVLGIPQRGSWWHAAATIGVIAATAVAGGLTLAVVGRNELQVTQLVMLVLLISLFFSGFLLGADRLREPLSWLGLAVPSTPGTSMLRDIQLRGRSAGGVDMIVLGTQFVVAVASALFAGSRLWRRGGVS